MHVSLLPNVLQYLTSIGYGVAAVSCLRNVVLILPRTFMISSIFMGAVYLFFLLPSVRHTKLQKTH